MVGCENLHTTFNQRLDNFQATLFARPVLWRVSEIMLGFHVGSSSQQRFHNLRMAFVAGTMYSSSVHPLLLLLLLLLLAFTSTFLAPSNASTI
jgi:hypothetical protein